MFRKMTNYRILEKPSEQPWLFTDSKCEAISFPWCGKVWKISPKKNADIKEFTGQKCGNPKFDN